MTSPANITTLAMPHNNVLRTRVSLNKHNKLEYVNVRGVDLTPSISNRHLNIGDAKELVERLVKAYNGAQFGNMLPAILGPEDKPIELFKCIGNGPDGLAYMAFEVDGYELNVQFANKAAVAKFLDLSGAVNGMSKSAWIEIDEEDQTPALFLKGEKEVVAVPEETTDAKTKEARKEMTFYHMEDGTWKPVHKAKRGPGNKDNNQNVLCIQSIGGSDPANIAAIGSMPAHTVFGPPQNVANLSDAVTMAADLLNGAEKVLEDADKCTSMLNAGTKVKKPTLANIERNLQTYVSMMDEAEIALKYRADPATLAEKLLTSIHEKWEGVGKNGMDLYVSIGPFNTHLENEVGQLTSNDFTDIFEKEDCDEAPFESMKELLKSPLKGRLNDALYNLHKADFTAQKLDVPDMPNFVAHVMKLTKDLLKQIYAGAESKEQDTDADMELQEEGEHVTEVRRMMMSKDDSGEVAEDGEQGECKNPDKFTTKQWDRIARVTKFFTNRMDVSGKGDVNHGHNMTLSAEAHNLHLTTDKDLYIISSSRKDDDGEERVRKRKIEYILQREDGKVKGSESRPPFTLHEMPEEGTILAVFESDDMKSVIMASQKRACKN